MSGARQVRVEDMSLHVSEGLTVHDQIATASVTSIMYTIFIPR